MIVLVDSESFAVQVGDEQIHPAIFVEIGGIETHSGTRPASRTVSDTGGGASFLKLSGSLVHEQKIGHGIVADPQIHQAVVVNVGRDHAPSFSEMAGDAGLLADVGERAISIVVVKNAAAILRDVQIRKSVVIVIANRNALTESACRYTRFVRNVGEGAIAIIFVQGVAQRWIGREKITLTAIHQVNVHPAVPVVI